MTDALINALTIQNEVIESLVLSLPEPRPALVAKLAAAKTLIDSLNTAPQPPPPAPAVQLNLPYKSKEKRTPPAPYSPPGTKQVWVPEHMRGDHIVPGHFRTRLAPELGAADPAHLFTDRQSKLYPRLEAIIGPFRPDPRDIRSVSAQRMARVQNFIKTTLGLKSLPWKLPPEVDAAKPWKQLRVTRHVYMNRYAKVEQSKLLKQAIEKVEAEKAKTAKKMNGFEGAHP